MQALWRDIRHTARALRKAPGFTAVVVLTLALGIGANTAIFSLMDQVLLRSLPVKEPSRLVLLDGPGAFRGRTMNAQTFSYPMYTDFRDRTQVFSGLLARYPTRMTLAWHGQSENVDGDLVSGNYFDVLGVRPAIGRVFNASDDRVPGAHPIVVISYGYWQRRFGGDPAILNQSVTVNGHPMTIVGVTGPGFSGVKVGTSSDVMVPLMMKPQMTPTWNDLDNRRSRWLTVIGRLAPGVSLEQASSQMNVIYRQINEQEITEIKDVSPSFRQRFTTKHLDLLPGGRGLSDLRAQFSTPLTVLMGMVGVVLLIASANVANLMLARTAARRKEIVLRLALGAGHARIIRQQLVESGLLAFGGAALGLVLAWWTGSALLAALPGDPVTRTLSSAPDARVLLFTLGLALFTALLFGLAPSVQAARSVVNATLKEEGGSVAGGGRQARVRRGLVILQVAMSMLLLAGAGLFARSLYNLTAVNPGFQVERLLTFSLDPTLSGYSQDRATALFQQLQEELGAVPGVKLASMSEIGMLSGNDWSMTVKVDGYQAKEDENMNPSVDGVAPRFFATMGIPLVAGREFSDSDAAGAPRVAIVNETMAKYYYGDTNPIGRRIGFGRDKATDIEIVGVVSDVRSQQLRDKAPRFMYIPYRQDDSVTGLTFFVRAAGDPSAAAIGIRQAVRRLDSNLPIADMKTMDAQVAESLFVERMVAMLSVAFGALATLLAAVGLYGVMAYAVARRTREIGIRMALGAERGRVLRMVLGEVAMMAVAGVGVGLVAAVYLTRKVQAQLFGLSPSDPLTLGTTVVFLLAVALFAGFGPARRATTIDPNLALRRE
jgi:predicted permease